MPPKKSKAVNDSAPLSSFNTTFTNTAWETFWALADDGRSEITKQITAVIALADGAFSGVTSFATKLNDRGDRLVTEAFHSLDQGGRALVAGSQAKGEKLLASYRKGSADLVEKTRDGARDVADRANATARAFTQKKAA